MTQLEETQVQIKTLTELVELRDRRLFGSWREMIADELQMLRIKERELRRAQTASPARA